MNKLMVVILVVFVGMACVPQTPTPSSPSTSSWYKDADGDGYGDPDTEVVATNKPDNTYVADNADCDDSVPGGVSINPGETEANDDQVDSDCDGALSKAPFSVGDVGPAGGIVFQTDGTNGLEAAPEDQDAGTGAEWGCYLTVVTAGSGASSLTDGYQNTSDLIAQNCSPDTPGNPLAANLVAAYSLNGYADWFLPAKDQLNAMYTELHQNGKGSFASDRYWTSSEYSDQGAWGQRFDTTGQFSYEKYRTWRVRAVRAF